MSTQHPTTVPHWTHNHEARRIRDDDVEVAELITGQRIESYADGRTHDVVLKDEHDSWDAMEIGVRAELSVADALDLEPLEVLDLHVSEKGDDGSDLVLPNGYGHRLDIKSHEAMPTGTPPKLLVKTDVVHSDDPADAYVLTQVWGDDHAVIHGWTTRRDLLNDGRVEGPPHGWRNWNRVLDAEDLRPVEELREWVDGGAL